MLSQETFGGGQLTGGCQLWRTCAETPTGQGMRNLTTRPTPMEIAAGTSFAPTTGCEF